MVFFGMVFIRMVFFAAVLLICYSGIGNCIFWSAKCDSVPCENG